MSQLPEIHSETLAPHDIAAERAVLAALMQADDVIQNIAFLKASDFYIIRHAWIFEAMKAVAEKRGAIDPVTVSAELDKRGRLVEVGGMGQIALLLTEGISAMNIEHYARLVHERSTRRLLITASQETARIGYADDTELGEGISAAQAAVAAVADHYIGATVEGGDAYSVAGEVLTMVDDWHQNPTDIRGMETGLSPLDVAVGGVEQNTLTYLAGRPGSGKSALLDQLLRGLAEKGAPALLFSLEMSKRAVMLRMACQMATVDSRLARNGRLNDEERSKLNKALGKLSEMPIDILALTSPTMAEMQAISRQYIRRRGTRVVMVDTINRVKSAGKSPYERMTMKSNEAADWAHSAPLAVIAAVQMSRTAEQRSNKQPELSDLRDSGELEQDADGVWGIYRPGYYEPENLEVAHLAELHILKHREGEAGGMVKLYWEPTWPGFARLNWTRLNIDASPSIPDEVKRRADAKAAQRQPARDEWVDPMAEVAK